jgi:hypothetical protein
MQQAVPKPIIIAGLVTLFVLTSCAKAPVETQAAAPAPAPATYDTRITIREIMASLVDPHADAIWNSLRVVSDSNGITEFYPETDEEWLSLRISAVSIIEGSNSLMMPDRKVAPPGAEGEFPEFEFTPQEVEQKLAADRQSWVGFAGSLQAAAIELLGAIDNRDTDKLTEWGAHLDEACENCHSVYWYRAGI